MTEVGGTEKVFQGGFEIVTVAYLYYFFQKRTLLEKFDEYFKIFVG